MHKFNPYRLFFLLFIVLFFAGQKNIYSQSSANSKIIELKSGSNTDYFDKDQVIKIIHSEDDFEREWELVFYRWFPKPFLPAVDFNKDQIILLMLPNSKKHRYRLGNIILLQENSQNIIQYEEIIPEVGCSEGTKSRKPFTFIKLPTNISDLKFRSIPSNINCIYKAF